MKPNESPADSAPEAASPFPPAFRWEASARWEAAASEAPTQVMGAVGRDTVGRDAAGATQGVRSSPSYQQGPGAVGDLFQPVGTPLDEPAGKRTDGSAPPWADPDLSPSAGQPSAEQPSAEQPIAGQPIAGQPIAGQPSAGQPSAEQQSAWLRQGPEVFATQSGSKQIIGIAVLAVVVLGLVGATVAYFLTTGPGRLDSSQIAAPQPTAAPRDLPAPPAALPVPVDTAHALIDPPGQARGGGGLFDLPQLRSTKLLWPQPIVDALQAGGMTDGVLKTTTVGSTTIGMFALTMPDQQTATTVAQTIATTQLDGGLKADDNRALQGMMVMATVAGSQSTAYRAVYVLYDRTIYVEVFGPNRAEVQATFDSLIKQQVTYAPPIVHVGR